MWGLNISGVARHFIWRAGNDLLPTRYYLCRKKIIDCDTCPICLNGAKTVSQVLWSCPVVSNVWGARRSPLRQWSSYGENFLTLWEDLCRVLKKDQLEVIVVIMRSIWHRRNLFIFEETFSAPQKVLITTMDNLEEFYQVQMGQEKKQHGRVVEETAQSWQRPEKDCCKANFDATIDCKNQTMGIGVIVRDGNGEILTALHEQRHGLYKVDAPVYGSLEGHGDEHRIGFQKSFV
ncbi:uncharacterized protein LOC121249293 [Juglans microcarpa x Juglans regia]|uniref:uncharacterized protein LOC121249293 n=1 Tax=Juglans microcarpa x Juglans regia TaxID=2249226 RepID=UPI001B7E731D|nr:uncharacterized protein LOC121249293 [Juglans microcarpa x Juglans regia]